MPNTKPREASAQESEENKKLLELFSFGFDQWLVRHSPLEVRERILAIDSNPMGRSQLNQLLHLCHEPGVSEGLYRYYWLSLPKRHVYDVRNIPSYNQKFASGDLITSLEHLRWGLYRLYVDALLFFGDVRHAFNELRVRNTAQLEAFFEARRFDTEALKKRGPSLPLVNIAKDNRYLISEMACKSYGAVGDKQSDLKTFLLDAFKTHEAAGGGKVSIRTLCQSAFAAKKNERQTEFLYSADGILDEEVENALQVERKYQGIVELFDAARKAALRNTEYFLSMVNDLDVYVATSMRNRSDFRKMADFCEKVFRHPSLKDLTLRYFDPTVSAAEGHEDKGLIECLMVKSAKILVYCAGERDSFGKDAEAAMALSLGKPVIFYCDAAERERFFSEVHPLSRLIQFETGVAVGALVTSSQDEVITLIHRIFHNEMEYELQQKASGLKLVDSLTRSTVRLQTRNSMLRETFWNYYHTKI
jgi:hypothetical protein